MINQERLFEVLSHPDFLAMKGLANEVPIFIKTYRPQEEDTLDGVIDGLCTRLSAAGIMVARVDLFDLVLEGLGESGWLARTIEREPSMPKKKLFDLLRNAADPKTRLVPRLSTAISDQAIQLCLITGVGRVFPYLRTHTVLENLQPIMMQHPVIMFFPGDYATDASGASQLRLFGQTDEFPVSKGLVKNYYRAFNLDHYRP